MGKAFIYKELRSFFSVEVQRNFGWGANVFGQGAMVFSKDAGLVVIRDYAALLV